MLQYIGVCSSPGFGYQEFEIAPCDCGGVTSPLASVMHQDRRDVWSG